MVLGYHCLSSCRYLYCLCQKQSEVALFRQSSSLEQLVQELWRAGLVALVRWSGSLGQLAQWPGLDGPVALKSWSNGLGHLVQQPQYPPIISNSIIRSWEGIFYSQFTRRIFITCKETWNFFVSLNNYIFTAIVFEDKINSNTQMSVASLNTSKLLDIFRYVFSVFFLLSC